MSWYPYIPDDELEEVFYEWYHEWANQYDRSEDHLEHVTTWFLRSHCLHIFIRKCYPKTKRNQPGYELHARVMPIAKAAKFDYLFAGDYI